MTLHAHLGANSVLRPRRPQPNNFDQWWSTSAGSSGDSSISTSREPSPSSSSEGTSTITSSMASNFMFNPSIDPGSAMTSSGPHLTTYHVTVTQPSSTIVFYNPTAVTGIASVITPSTFLTVRDTAQVSPVCIGNGLDATSDGIIATVVLPTAIGLLIWLAFAIIRPRYRQIYALREWFVQTDLRPKPLGSNIGAFLFPNVPLITSVPSDVSDAGRSAATDAKLFPSDEELIQRTLWISLTVVLGWTLVGLGGALPLYLVSTPCLAQSAEPPTFGGAYSTIYDLSLLRLLQLLESGSVTSATADFVAEREVVNGTDENSKARLRILIITVLTLALAVVPALYRILKEFNRMVAFRKRWLEVRCAGKEMGWLSARKAPGFVGWGEKRLKDYIVKVGLSSLLEGASPRDRNRERQRRNQSYWSSSQQSEQADMEIDIQSLFSICDTHSLALLIEERDEILDNLEIAETKYISSFRLSTPDPSIADLEVRRQPEAEEKPDRPYISRPRALGGGPRPRPRHRRHNPAQATSSFAPTSFVAPSQYYKLRGLRSVNAGNFADGTSTPISLSDSFQQRVVGSRFQEVNRDSLAYNRLPLGSHVKIERGGELGPSSPVPDPRYYGPNHAGGSSSENGGTTTEYATGETSGHQADDPDDDWVDLMREIDFGDSFGEGSRGVTDPSPRANDEVPLVKPRPRPIETPSTERRETFPLRTRAYEDATADAIPPPHLRLQPRQPFVRPASGLNYDDLGAVYTEINQWRSKLKAINAEITDAQQECYVDIAEGVRVKGWIVMGRGLRFIPGVELIEGRAKEDIRWGALQHESNALDVAALWTVIAITIILLAVSLVAVTGLALGTAPNIAHYLPFFQPLSENNGLVSGLATSLAPAVGATAFIIIALAIIQWAAGWAPLVSISAVQVLTYKIMFFVLSTGVAAWVIAIGALLFALEAFSSGHAIAGTVASGSVYMAALALVITVTTAVIVPGILLLQPFRLWSVLRAEKDAITPRQRFRAVYPRTYDPSYATGACVLATVFASAFSLIFPLIGPAAAILLFLTLVAHRFLIGYVYARTLSQTGGLLQIWILKRLGTIVALQPLLLGLILLSRRLWIEGGVLAGVAMAVVLAVETYARLKTRQPGLRTLRADTRQSLAEFATAAKPSALPLDVDGEGTSLMSSARGTRARGSMASVLEMMSLTLAVMPSASRHRGPLPLHTETLDDLTATDRAARTHPDAPPHLPPLPFADHAEEMAGVLYAPELLAPSPIIWLPNDSAGVAKSEAIDLQKYHEIHVTLDVRAKDDVLPRRSNSRVHR